MVMSGPERPEWDMNDASQRRLKASFDNIYTLLDEAKRGTTNPNPGSAAWSANVFGVSIVLCIVFLMLLN